MKKKSRQFILAVFVIALTAVAVLTAGCTPKQTEQTASTQESATESLSAKDMTVEEMLKHLKLDGVEVGLPCKVKDLPKTMELRKGYNMTGGRAVGDLYYNGKKAGAAHFDEFSEVADSLKEIDMSTGYEEEVIHAFSFRMDCFDILGVTYNDMENEIIQKLGAVNKNGWLVCGDNEREDVSHMSFFFGNDVSMSVCIMTAPPIAQEDNTNE